MKNPVRLIKFSAIFFCLFLVNRVSAQTVSLGAHTGVTWSNVSVPALNGAFGFKSFSALSGGLTAEIGVNDLFSIQPELNYTEKGFKLSSSTDVNMFGAQIPIGGEAITDVRYVEAPILAKLKFGTQAVHFYVFAGPSIGYAIDGRLKTYGTALIEIKLSDTPINLSDNNYSRFELGGVAGAGIDFSVGAGQFFADARYSRGLTESYQIPVVGVKVMNEGVGLNIGYKINIQ